MQNNNRLYSILILFFCLTSCVVVQQGDMSYEQTPISRYQPMPVNRERNGITYFNLNNINRIRSNEVNIEIIHAPTRSELELTEAQLEYLQVLRYGDELYLSYKERTNQSGRYDRRAQRESRPIRIYLKHSLSGIKAENSARVEVREVMTTPFMEIHMDKTASVKCDVNAESFKLYGDRFSSYDGWIEAERLEVNLRGTAEVRTGGMAGDVNVITGESSSFFGASLRGRNVSVRADSGSLLEIAVEKKLSAKATDGGQILYRPLSAITINKEYGKGGSIREI